MKRSLIFLLLLLGFPFLLQTAAMADNSRPLGTAAALLDAMSSPPATVSETALGNVTADAVMTAAGTDLALVPAGFFSANIQPGAVSDADIRLALPEQEPFVVVQLTPARLHRIMEQALSGVVLTESYAIDQDASTNDGFLQIAGFTVRYDPNMLPGNRIHTLTIAGVSYSSEDTEPLFTAAMPHSLATANSTDVVVAETTLTAADALIAYFQSEGTVAPPDFARLHAMAVRDNDYINRFPVVLLCFAAIVVVVCGKGLVKMKASNGSDDRRYR